MNVKTWSRISLYLFYGLLAYMPLHIFLSTWLGTSFDLLEAAKIAKDIVLVIGLSVALLVSARRPWFKELLRDRLVWVIAAYGLLTVILALIKPTDQDAEILGLVYNLRFLLFFLYGVLLARLFDAKRVQKTSVRIVLVVGVVVIAFGLIQYLILPNDALKHLGYTKENGVLPAFFIDDKPDLERIMSTVRDPNSLGSYLIIIAPLIAAALLLVREKRNKLALSGLLILTLLAEWFTFSRSGWLGFAIAVSLFILLADSRFKTILVRHWRRVTIMGLVATAVVVGGLFVFRNSYFIQNVVFHADESTELEDPNELRVRFLREAATDVVSEPLGNGPGTAGLASIRNDVQGTELNENYYVQIAREVGILGLVLFIGLLVIVGVRLLKLHAENPIATALLASFTGLAITNFLVHIWSNEAVAYTWWGLAGTILGVAKINDSRRKQRKSQ